MSNFMGSPAKILEIHRFTGTQGTRPNAASVLNVDFKGNEYRTRANKGRGLYSKNIFWLMIAANNQERLLIKKYYLDINVPMLE